MCVIILYMFHSGQGHSGGHVLTILAVVHPEKPSLKYSSDIMNG